MIKNKFVLFFVNSIHVIIPMTKNGYPPKSQITFAAIL